MGLNRKIAPVGVDIVIDAVQEHLYNGLIALGWTDYESYPRAYKNETDNGLIPEIYTSNEEYKEVFFDDGFNVSSFWLANDVSEQQSDPNYSTTIKVIFQAKLDKLYPLISHRADEEMHRDISLLLNQSPLVMRYEQKKTTGIKKIYSDEGLESTNSFEDISNYHVVKFDLEINFSYEC